eukprot:TRINITY_DN2729_c0_g1_i1.p1 TRINITY_DN2729_c0_g1~~TRINITY_DN2729_c0_g1_i1.p1  ORF type:complete len:435 (-),score=54.52 TRINITY_DN2729_c0_g1_i1:121-1425(-)
MLYTISNPQAVELLLSANPDVSLKNSNGLTAAKMAKQKNIQQLFKDHRKNSRTSWNLFKHRQARKRASVELPQNTPPPRRSPRKTLADQGLLKKKERQLFMMEQELKAKAEALESREAFVKSQEKTLKLRAKELQQKETGYMSRLAALQKMEEMQHNAELSLCVPIVKYSDLKITKVLGSGGFSRVNEAVWRGDSVAVKIISQDSSTDKERAVFMKTFQSEALFLSKLRHSCIVTLMAVCLEYPNLALIMEKMDQSLKDLLPSLQKNFVESTVLRIVTNIVRGMNYLHSLNPSLIHRDLKPANVLLTESLEARISDLGLARTSTKTFCADMKGNYAGSPRYMSPECLRQEDFNERADVYSFGVILWQLIYGLVPWEGKSATEIIALVGYNREQLPHSGVPEGKLLRKLYKIMCVCLLDDVSARSPFSIILQLLT